VALSHHHYHSPAYFGWVHHNKRTFAKVGRLADFIQNKSLL
jgi:hypothetical protein